MRIKSVLASILIILMVFLGVSFAPLKSTAANQIENVGLYYGWTSCVNNASNNTQATAEFAKFDVLIFGDGLQETSHGDHANTQIIMQNLKAQGKKVFGYIPLGVEYSADSLSMTELKSRVDKWAAMSAYGIFLDEYGFDYGVTRTRQNEIMDYIHSKGMYAVMNAWIPVDALDDKDETGANNPPHVTANDYYFMEDWIYDQNNVQPESTWKPKVEQSMAYHNSKGVKIIAFGTVTDPYTQGVNDPRFINFATQAATYGVQAMQFTETGHSASSGKLGFFPAPAPSTPPSDPPSSPPVHGAFTTAPVLSASIGAGNVVDTSVTKPQPYDPNSCVFSYDYYIDGQLYTSIMVDPVNTFNLQPGTHPIYVIAKDTVHGWTMKSNTVTVTVPDPAPQTTMCECCKSCSVCNPQ